MYGERRVDKAMNSLEFVVWLRNKTNYRIQVPYQIKIDYKKCNVHELKNINMMNWFQSHFLIFPHISFFFELWTLPHKFEENDFFPIPRRWKASEKNKTNSTKKNSIRLLGIFIMFHCDWHAHLVTTALGWKMWRDRHVKCHKVSITS